MRPATLSLLCLLASACICDCRDDNPYMFFNLINSQGDDYLISHGLDYHDDIRLFAKRKEDNRKNVYRDYSVGERIRGDTVNSIIFDLYVDEEIEWLYFELDGAIRDSVTMTYSKIHDDCCGDLLQIETTNYHQATTPFVPLDTLSFTIPD